MKVNYDMAWKKTKIYLLSVYVDGDHIPISCYYTNGIVSSNNISLDDAVSFDVMVSPYNIRMNGSISCIILEKDEKQEITSLARIN